VVSDDRLAERVCRLRRLRHVPDDVLMDIIWERGCCTSRLLVGEVPACCENAEDPDRALAEYLCADRNQPGEPPQPPLRARMARSSRVRGGGRPGRRRSCGWQGGW
jgi:hypothetical protein